MTEQIRINKLKLDTTLSGKPVVHLHAPGAQYSQFPVLYLFDLGLLAGVGISPNTLKPDKDVHVNLWAHYEVSEKTNSKGNHYKDVVSLEAIDAPATSTSVDTSAILAELRAIKALLLDMATGSAPLATEQTKRIHALNQASRTGPLKTPAPAWKPPEPEPELSEAEARTEFYTLAGPAVTEGADVNAINDLAKSANGDGWNGALARLRELLAN